MREKVVSGDRGLELSIARRAAASRPGWRIWRQALCERLQVPYFEKSFMEGF